MTAPILRRRRVRPPPQGRSGRQKAISVAFLAFAGFTLWLGFRHPSTATFVGSVGFQTGTMKADATACASEASMQAALSLAAQPIAYGKYVLDPANGCMPLSQGTPIEIDEVKGDLRRFHVRGSPDSLWATSATIK